MHKRILMILGALESIVPANYRVAAIGIRYGTGFFVQFKIFLQSDFLANIFHLKKGGSIIFFLIFLSSKKH